MQRYFEHIRHLDRVGRQCKRRFHPADDRRNAVAGHGFVFGELTQHGDTFGWKANFFGSLTQCRGDMR